MRRLSSSWTYWIGGAALIVAAWIGAYALWLAVRDPVDFEADSRAKLARFITEQDRAQVALAAVQSRLARLQGELATETERRRTAERALASLQAGDHWWSKAWDRLFGDSAEVRTKEERLARLEKAKIDATARIAELKDSITRATWERDGVEIDLARVNRSLAAVERDRSKTRHYLALAWRRLRWYVALALAAWFLAPVLWRRRYRLG